VAAQKKNAGAKSPAFSLRPLFHGLLIVVEPALARFVITFAARPVGRAALMATHGPRDFGATAAAVKPAACRRRGTGEIGAPIAHRAAIAGAGAAVTTAATAAVAAAATTTVAAATTAAAIATATAATAVAATAATITTAAAIGRAWAARTEAAAIAATTATAAAESTTAAATGLTFDGFTNRNRATIEQCAVHGLHGRGALIICFHLEEGEATAAAGLAIHDHFRRGNGAELREGF
jgi:hypothetical protein